MPSMFHCPFFLSSSRVPAKIPSQGGVGDAVCGMRATARVGGAASDVSVTTGVQWCVIEFGFRNAASESDEESFRSGKENKAE